MNGPTEAPQQAARRQSASAIRDGYVPEALHAYTYPAGGVWYWRIRLKNPHTGEKWIRPMRLNGAGLELGEPDFPDGKPIYRLHDLTGRPGHRVIVVEGEWCADRLADRGLLATTSGAADSATKADWRPLTGRDVTIWPDNDEAGRRYADAVVGALLALECTVRVIDVDAVGLPPKADAVDWLKVNPAATAAEIAALPCVEARQHRARGDGQVYVALEIGELLARNFPPKEPLLSPWLRLQDLVMVYAKRGVGKTHFCLSLAYVVASGGKFLEWQAPKPRRVLYIDGEMPGAAIKDRLAALVDVNELEPPEGFFRIVTPDVQPIPLPDLATAAGQAALHPLIADAELIVLDNLSALVRAGVENEGESWIPMATWALERRREGRAVAFVHHAGKGGQQRGSSRREDLLDVVVCLKHPSDYTPDQGARFEMVFEKARGLFGADVETIEAALQEGADGKTSWTWKAAEGATVDRVAELHGIGMKPAEIAGELGVHRSTVYRALKGRHGGGS
ncbi:MAG: AAA family ATPase [Gammaproteobacteria bacterium]